MARGRFATTGFAFFSVDWELAGIGFVIQHDFFQTVVIQIVVSLFAVPRVLAAGASRAAATSPAARFAAFFRLTRFARCIVTVDWRFGRIVVACAIAFAPSTAAPAATSSPPASTRGAFAFSFVRRIAASFGVAAIFPRKFDRFRLPRFAHAERFIVEFAARLAAPIAALGLDFCFALHFCGTCAFGDFVGLLIGGAEDFVPQAHTEPGSRRWFGRFWCRFDRCGRSCDFLN